MPEYRVELRGEAREVLIVEADSAEEARENWVTGSSQIIECSSMEVYSVELDEDDE